MSTIESLIDNPIHATIKCRAQLVTALFAWLLLNLSYVGWEAKPSHNDAFFFKEAGINLATRGQFTVDSLPHMNPDQTIIYSHYAPMYPLLYGVWTSIVGVGLKQSIFFDHILKACRTLIAFFFLWPWLKPRLNFGDRKGQVALGFLLVGAFLPNWNDRPEELALFFGLCAWYLVRRPRVSTRSWALSGLLLGLCTGTSIMVGILFAIGCFMRMVSTRATWRDWGALLATSGAMVLAWVVPLVWLDTQVFRRYAREVALSIFPLFNKNALAEQALFEHWYGSFWQPAAPVIALLIVTLGLALYLWKAKAPQSQPNIFREFLVIAMAFLPMSVLVWTFQPRYLWISSFLIFVAALGLWLQEDRKGHPAVIGALFFIALCPAVVREAKFLFRGMEQPITQSNQAIRDKVLSYIEHDAKLAVAAEHYFAFRAIRPVALAPNVCPWLDHYDYVYLTPRKHMKQDAGLPCDQGQKCFTVLSDFREQNPVTIFGIKLPVTVRGNGGILFKNTQCKSPDYVASQP